VTYDNGVFIWSLLSETKTYAAQAAPGFAAFTLFNALATIENSGNFDLVAALVLNVGVTHARTTSGTSNVTTTTGVSFSAQTRAEVSGAVMTRTTGLIAVQCSPTFSTVLGSTVNLGTVTALKCVAPAVALFGTSAGVENLTAYYGIDFDDITFASSGDKVVVRSAMTDAADRFFLQNNGGARSDFGGGSLLDCGNIQVAADLLGVSFGASDDVNIGWGSSGFFFLNFAALSDQIRISNPSAQRFLFDADSISEFNFNCSRFSLGGQTGSVGNQVGVFVAPTRSASVAGEWSDFLLTQAGNLTADAALTLVAGWTVNAPSITIGTGSVTTAVALNVGGNPNQGTNRYGLRVISNPSGGTLNYCARFEGAAGVRVDGVLEHTGSTLGFYGSTPVAQTAAYSVTGTSTDRALDSADTLSGVIDVLGTLIQDLQATGLLG
jgi:hypothetical protein